jgi:hypothetical protein
VFSMRSDPRLYNESVCVVKGSREPGVLHKILIAFSDLTETCVEQSGFYGFRFT